MRQCYMLSMPKFGYRHCHIGHVEVFWQSESNRFRHPYRHHRVAWKVTKYLNGICDKRQPQWTLENRSGFKNTGSTNLLKLSAKRTFCIAPPRNNCSPTTTLWRFMSIFVRSWGKNSEALTIGPATNWGKKATNNINCGRLLHTFIFPLFKSIP